MWLGAAIALVMSLPVAPAHAAATTQIITVVTSDVGYGNAVGGILSIIDVCPKNAVLDLSLTRRLNLVDFAEDRPLSRELWPRGMVSRWRVAFNDDFSPRIYEQSLACRESVPAGATRHVAGVTAISRLWGPAPASAWLWSSHQVRTIWAGGSAISDLQLTRVRGRSMHGFITQWSSDTAFVLGDQTRRLAAGQYSETSSRLAVTSRPGRAPELDNIHVPGFTVPRLGGGHLRWSAYRGKPVVIAVGTPAQVRTAVRHLIQAGATLPTTRVVGLVHAFSKDKFRPPSVGSMERRTGALPVPVGYAALPQPALWFLDAAANVEQVPDAFDAGVIAFVDRTGSVIRFLPVNASQQQLTTWTDALH